jgi:hypothetical protein
MHSPRTAATALSLFLAAALPAAAQTVTRDSVDAGAVAAGLILEGRLTGDASAEYVVTGAAGQILSVDLLSDNGALNFNITPAGGAEAIFIGSISGTVADIPLPAAGDYVVQVYLMRAAARRNEGAPYTLGLGLGGGDFADGLAGGPDWWQVTGLSEGGALNIRTGPHTRYPARLGVPNGTALQNLGCRMTGPDRWCRIRRDGSDEQGWVAGRYLTEGAAP